MSFGSENLSTGKSRIARHMKRLAGKARERGYPLDGLECDVFQSLQ